MKLRKKHEVSGISVKRTDMRRFFETAFVIFALGTERAFAAGDLITADKTLFVQFAIFLVALYLLNNLFFKPLMDLADRRESATSGSVKDAQELVEKARKMTAQYDEALKEAREQALSERARLTKSALAEAEEIVSSARDEARRLFEERAGETLAQVEKAKDGMKSEIEDIAGMLTRKIKTGSGDV